VSQAVTGTTMLRRQIGRKLELLRKAAGITMEQAAERLDRARATLHRIENGAETVRFRQADVEQMLKLYEASAEDVELVLAMAAATRENKNWWHDYVGSGLPRWFHLYIGLEAAAARIRQYETELVPGLFQTKEYAEHIFRMPGAIDTKDQAEQLRAIELRLERQALLTRFSPPQLSVILNEAVLRRPVGSAKIMTEQLNQIIKASELPNVTVRVLPFSAGLHAGAMAGAFSILEFPRGRDGEEVEPTVAYLDSPTGAIYLDKPHESGAYLDIWADMEDRALTESRSRSLIQAVAKEYSNA
jgi:transcriptional regulator with XRE-family HTH domain